MFLNRPISWDNHAPSTYFTLKEGSSIEQLNKKIAGFIKAKYDNSRVTLLLAGSITLAIALLTVSFQAIKAATENPVESLKYE